MIHIPDQTFVRPRTGHRAGVLGIKRCNLASGAAVVAFAPISKRGDDAIRSALLAGTEHGACECWPESELEAV